MNARKHLLEIKTGFENTSYADLSACDGDGDVNAKIEVILRSQYFIQHSEIDYAVADIVYAECEQQYSINDNHFFTFFRGLQCVRKHDIGAAYDLFVGILKNTHPFDPVLLLAKQQIKHLKTWQSETAQLGRVTENTPLLFNEKKHFSKQSLSSEFVSGMTKPLI